LGLAVGLLVAAESPSVAGKASAPADPVALRADLQGTDAARAIAAAAALGAARTPATLDTLLDALATGLTPDVAVAALDALAARAAAPEARAATLGVLDAYRHHRDARVRAHALAGLAALPGSPEAERAVLAGLGDPDAAVRASCGRALAARGDRRALAPLLSLYASGDEAASAPLADLASGETVIQIAELAGKVPDPLEARTLGRLALRKGLGGDELHVGVVRALGAIPGADALEALRAVAASTVPPAAARREAEALVAARSAP
jgi:HEAT repeat protein